MKNRSEFDGGAQANQQFRKYLETEDFVDPSDHAIAPTTRTMIFDIQENAFRAYNGDWDKALLIINEGADCTAHFKPATKYKGVAMWDDEEDE